MAVALEVVVQHLTDSGIISPGTLERFVPPMANQESGEDLLRTLCRENLLTAYQSQQVMAGRAQSLILGGYLILDLIGAGGMGQVFKAEHRRMKRIVAIKTLPEDVMADEAAVARFQREVQAAAKLRHPNIVATDDAAEFNGIHFLVMEYIEGLDLSALVRRDGPISIADGIGYILQTARGLEYAHKKGVIHRDIKPGNLLLDTEGAVKILDMGLARIEKRHAQHDTRNDLTLNGDVFGTVDFMSPEQAVNTKDADSRSDIYSLGCTFFFLLSGRMIYGGETIVQKILAHREVPIPSLRTVCPRASCELEAVFQKMVAKKTDDRYQTAGDLIADLEQFSVSPLASRPIRKGNKASVVNAMRPSWRDPVASPRWRANGNGTRGGRRLWALFAITFFGIASVLGIFLALKLTRETRLGLASRFPEDVATPNAVVTDLQTESEVAQGQNPDNVRVGEGADLGLDSQPSLNDSVADKSGPGSIDSTPQTDDSQKAMMTYLVDDDPMSIATHQLEAIIVELQKLNPEFEGVMTPVIEDGIVTELQVHSEHLNDIAPLEKLTGLTVFDCDGCVELADLLPLAECALTKLSCNRTSVSDLTLIKGMPLTGLKCDSSAVSDLSPLRELPLEELSIADTNVEDLSMLSELPLTKLDCRNTRVTDLTPLAGVKLTILKFSPDAITRGMDTIRQMESLVTILTSDEAAKPLPASRFWKKYDRENPPSQK